MTKFYYLKSCSTCIKILKTLNLPESAILQNIKNEPITESQLEEMKILAGSYEALFSKRAQLYKSMNLKEQTLTETDYKNYILEHFTFLKRPVMIHNNTIFIGNTAKVTEAAKLALHE